MSDFVERLNRMLPEKRLYTLRTLPGHLAGVDQKERLHSLLTNFEFMEAKVSAFGPQPLSEDYELSDEDDLGLIQNELQRAAHILQREPEVLASHLHNMLYLFEGESDLATPLLEKARKALHGQSWLRLTNRPLMLPRQKALIRVLDHGEMVNVIAVSPDGTILASAGKDSIVRLWDPVTGTLLAVLKEHAAGIKDTADSLLDAMRMIMKGYIMGVSALAWSPDSTFLASAGSDGVVWLWDPATWALKAVLQEYTGENQAKILAWSPSGTTLALGCRDCTVRLWDATTRKQRVVLRGHTDEVKALVWSPDGRLLASAGERNVIRLWDPAIGVLKGVLKGGRRDTIVTEVLAWSPNNTLLASGSGDGTVRLWDPATGFLRLLLKVHNEGVNAMAWSPDGTILASVGNDAVVVLSDLVTGERRAVLMGHTGLVSTLAWFPDGAMLASGSSDGTVRLWNPGKGELVPVLTGHTKADAYAARIMRWLKETDLDLHGTAFDLQRIAATNIMKGLMGASRDLLRKAGFDERHASAIEFSAWSPNGNVLASTEGDGTVALWEPVTGERQVVLADDTNFFSALTWSPDGTILASAGSDGTVALWEPVTGEQLVALEGHTDRVSALAWSPDGATLASGSRDETVRLWDAATGKQRTVLQSHCPFWVVVLAWAPDGTLLASVCERMFENVYPIPDKTVRLWDPSTGKQRVALRGHTDRVNTLAWSPDGVTLASGSFNGTVRLWDSATGIPKTVLKGHTRSVNALAWSPDGTLLASGSNDNTVRIWNLESSECHLVVHFLSSIIALQFSADGRILRAADNGAATHRQPIPYLFDLCNIEIRPAVMPPESKRRQPWWAFWSRVQKQWGDGSGREIRSWIISTLIWLPLLIPVLGHTVGTVSTSLSLMDRVLDWPLLGGLLLAWAMMGLGGKLWGSVEEENVLSLAAIVAFVVASILVLDLAGDPVVGLAGVIAIGLVVGMAIGVASGLVGDVARNYAGKMMRNKVDGVPLSLAIIVAVVVFGITGGLAGIIASTLAFVITFCLTVFANFWVEYSDDGVPVGSMGCAIVGLAGGVLAVGLAGGAAVGLAVSLAIGMAISVANVVKKSLRARRLPLLSGGTLAMLALSYLVLVWIYFLKD